MTEVKQDLIRVLPYRRCSKLYYAMIYCCSIMCCLLFSSVCKWVAVQVNLLLGC